MKIGRSLKLYVLVAMLAAGITTILSFSFLSVGYFFSGLDVAMKRAMVTKAVYQKQPDTAPLIEEDLWLFDRWQDIPSQVRQQFDPNELETGVLTKQIQQSSIFSPPEQAYFLMKVDVDGKTRYVTTYLSQDLRDKIKIGKLPHQLSILLTAVAALLLFSVVLMFVMKKVATPVEQLGKWAKSLNKDNLNQPEPDFHYSELNSLAKLIRSSLSEVQQGLEREQRFLGYASHELRTPIAVTRTNTQLLAKMIEKEVRKEKQLEVLERIERAGFTMTDLTETLLWLTRQEDRDLPSAPLKLGELTRQLNTDLTYLLRGKYVEVSITSDDYQAELPEPLCRIIITNLIRNAFQHTQQGSVEITQQGNQLTIHNQCSAEHDHTQSLGFGLGLELVEKLSSKYQWQYTSDTTESGMVVKVEFG
ncbi:HAMP domain-containing sensor histidine kinase [Vibrio sp. SCSIO 43136]|uniref:sensor histidine kinase n=1 Tax=Vibrio sp. SCSIO 43136 TaxID=2819101 RepID=UPI0020763873|nr:HAMP domain-containing sensor histidine kinase [Vibrio sp. SCSIO 43136]USD67441.1 HAMP domain-containing histidine kinase [Vibrio sp. SCSIO 43136]